MVYNVTPKEQQILNDLSTGNTGGFTKTDWQTVRLMESVNNQAAAAGGGTPYNYPTSGGGSTGGGTGTGTNTNTNTNTDTRSSQDLYYDWLKGEQERQARATATSFLSDILTQYGLGSLAGQVEGLINTWGTNTGVIAEKLRQTSEYKTRFKGLVALQGKGNTDIRNEAEYIDLESRYRGVFRENGIPGFLGEPGSQAEIDSLADIIGNYTLSVAEVAERVHDAQRVVADTAPEVRQALQDYYGINSTDLVEYALDQERTMKRFNAMANTAVFGGYARQRGLDASLSVAEQVAGLAGDDDINDARRIAQLNNDLQSAQSLATGGQRLAAISKDQFSDDEAIQTQFELDLGATEKKNRLASQERARFSGQSALSKTSLAQRRAR